MDEWAEDQNQPAKVSDDGRDEGCTECSFWFLGCLRGREKWKDKAIRPNYRRVVRRDGTGTGVCDGFELDSDPHRHGRIVYNDPSNDGFVE